MQLVESQNTLDLLYESNSAAIDNMNAGLCLISRNMEIMWLNKVHQTWFGPSKDLVGKKCYMIFEKREHICDGCPVAKVFRDKKTHISNIRRGFTTDGEKRYYRVAASPIFNSNGDIEKVLELVIDITERRNCEVKARRISAGAKKLNKTLKNIADERASELKLADEELRIIFELGNRLVSSLDVNDVLQTIVNTVPSFLNVSGCIVRVFDNAKASLTLEAASGLSKDFIEGARSLKIGEGVSGMVAESGMPISIPDVMHDSRVRYYEECCKEGIRSLLAVPIAFKSKILGTIIAYSKNIKHFTASEINLISTFAIHAAIALNNATLHNKIQLSYYSTIAALVKAVEAKDPYTSGHSERVTTYAFRVAKEMNLDQKSLEVLTYSGKLHDIGKIAIPDFILQKPGPLTSIEKAEVETHPIKGIHMILPIKFLEKCLPVIRHHHERYDGNGYPDKLKGDEIPVLSRILAVADAFDAMISERPYRKSIKVSEALLEIKKNLKSQFDPRIGALFIDILQKQYNSVH
ncbi:MAG: GAF domain-containing protein [Candidatus Omnitrophica bacterium]|nr:GAF domain-containing protein [Candidatus Omnitrophota bacterium]